jgi:hypothetical protein
LRFPPLKKKKKLKSPKELRMEKLFASKERAYPMFAVTAAEIR